MAYLKHTWEDGELITTDKMNSIEVQLEKLSDDIDTQNESIAAIQSSIAGIDGGGTDGVEALVSRITELESQVADLTLRLQALESGDFSTRVAALETLSTKVTELEERITALEPEPEAEPDPEPDPNSEFQTEP